MLGQLAQIINQSPNRATSHPAVDLLLATEQVAITTKELIVKCHNAYVGNVIEATLDWFLDHDRDHPAQHADQPTDSKQARSL
jgi:hypothetical protein